MSLIFKKSTAQPQFTVAAAITGGTPDIGTELTCTYTVTRARANNVVVRWYSYTRTDGVQPNGETLIGTGATYVLTGNENGRYVRAIVTATNPAGAVQSATAYTALIGVIEPPDPPSIVTGAAITGSVEVGATLTCTVDFSGEDSITYQWWRYASSAGTGGVQLGTSSTQVLSESEAGLWIGCVATGTNAAGSTQSVAALVGPVANVVTDPPVFSTAAAIQGVAVVGASLQVTYAVTDADSVAFQWYEADDVGGTGLAAISGATSNVFVIQEAQNGKVIRCVVSATNAVDTTTSTSGYTSEVSTATVIPITQGAVGSGPYYITQPGSYQLAEDITTKGTGIVIHASNVTLDLGGRTITFDDDGPFDPANADFSNGTTGWDLTNAPSASHVQYGIACTGASATGLFTAAGHGLANGDRVSFSHLAGGSSLATGMPYLDDPYYVIEATADTFKLSATEGGAAVSLGSDVTSGVVIEWGGYELQYCSKRLFTGSGVLEFPESLTTSSGSEYIEATSPIALTVGENYALQLVYSHAYTGNLGASCPTVAVELWADAARQHELVMTQSVTRGHALGAAAFTATHASYTLRVRVTGNPLFGTLTPPTYSLYLDSVSVNRGPTAGIVAGQNAVGLSTSRPQDITGAGTAARDNIQILNGSVVQGRNRSYAPFGVAVQPTAASFIPSNEYKLRIQNVNSTLYGADGSHFRASTTSNTYSWVLIEGCVCDGRWTLVRSRDNFTGNAVTRLRGVIRNNTFANHPHAGIYGGTLITARAGQGQVYGNTFSSRQRYTNGFQVFATQNEDVYQNLVDSSGEYSGRGVSVGGLGGRVYDNVIYAQPNRLMAEYGGYGSFGDYAVQCETTPAGVTVEIVGNTIHALASQGPDVFGGSGFAIAVRLNKTQAGANIVVRDNTIHATATAGGYAWAYGLASPLQSADIRDNAVITNSGYLRAIQSSNRHYRDTITINPTDGNSYRFFQGDFGAVIANVLVDPVYVSGKSTLEAALIYPEVRYGDTPSAGLGAVRFAWTITFQTGVAGATVEVYDSTSTLETSGTADASGVCVLEVLQQRNSNVVTTLTPHTVRVNGGAPTAFTADAAKTVNLT